MKRPSWKLLIAGTTLGIFALFTTREILGSRKEQQLMTQASGGRRDHGSSFVPTQLWQAASPGAALMEAFSPGRGGKRVIKTVGLALEEKEDSSIDPPADKGSVPQKLIRTGQVSIEVPDFDKAAKDLGAMVESLSGYVADSQVHRNNSGTRSGTITLRIPAPSYESAGSRIRTLGKVISERTAIQDVTKAYSDLTTKLQVKREALNRIRELLRKNSGNLKEVLEAEKEITRISEEINLAEGERQYFEHQVRLSTLTVELQEPEVLSDARPSSWLALSETFRDSMAMVAGSLAFMLRLLLVLLPWALAGWAILALVRWRRKKRTCPGSVQPSTPHGKG